MRKPVGLFCEYWDEVCRQFNPYADWIKECETYCDDYVGEYSFSICSLPEFFSRFNPQLLSDKKYIILFANIGNPRQDYYKCFEKYFNEHPDVSVIYPDEDFAEYPMLASKDYLHSIGADTEHSYYDTCRFAPFFKPDWSPETILEFNYLGNMIAVRTEVFKQISDKDIFVSEDDWRINFYNFVLVASEHVKIAHLPQVLFHKTQFSQETDRWGNEPQFDDIKLAYCKRNDIKAYVSSDNYGCRHIMYEPDEKPLVSIVIPSKDNPNLIDTCVGSIRRLTKYSNYEILVIDNGSSDENRLLLEKLAQQYEFSYNYMPMEFNFSKMCNVGVKLSHGELVLLLNDDCEVVTPDWIDILSGQAMQTGIGCVGAKLLYPDGETIQHVGISNSQAGPVHRLHNYSDKNLMYYGRNRYTYDILGVTAACLMVKRTVYDEVNCFDEAIKVAYNDVDFCFKVFEAGYRNVIRNDAVLLHHESITRGRDVSPEKLARLESERETLYARHPEFSPDRLAENFNNSIDPYCNNTARWKRNSLFGVNYLFEHERTECKSAVYVLDDTFTASSGVIYPRSVVDEPREGIIDRSRVMVTVDKVSYEIEDDTIYGWALVTKKDNAYFESTVLLKAKDGTIYFVTVYKVLRDDVYRLIEKQENTYLSGFFSRIKRGTIPSGTYTIGVLLTSKYKKKAYAKFTENTITIG